MFCQKCGCENKDGAKYCQQCGALIGFAISKEHSTQINQKSNKKNKKIGIILIVSILLVLVLTLRYNKLNDEPPGVVEVYMIVDDFLNDEYSDVDDCIDELNKIAKKTADSEVSHRVPYYYNVIDAFEDKNQKQAVALATIELFEYMVGDEIENHLDYPENSALTYSFFIEFARRLVEYAYG